MGKKIAGVEKIGGVPPHTSNLEVSVTRLDLSLALALVVCPSLAAAQEVVAVEEGSIFDAAERNAFDRPFTFSGYVSGWAGSYLAGGIGGRVGWEPFPELGVEVFGEGHIVEWESGIRHDHQIGFNLYVPLEVLPNFRIRPLFGFCTVFSLVEPDSSSSPRADDVLFGAHLGVGIEVGVEQWGSWFLEAQGAMWAGHDRSQSRWTGAVEDTYAPFGTAQVITGFTIHFGDF